MSDYFYAGYMYSQADHADIVAALVADPDELPAFRSACMATIDGMMNMQAYASAQDAFDMLCRVMTEVYQQLGRPVMAAR